MKNDFYRALQNRKVLVTGGAGFVGSNLVRALTGYGASVTVLDNLETGSLDLLNNVHGCHFVKGDVCDLNLVKELISDKEYVVHAAARNIIVSTRNPLSDYETNIGGTLNILLAAKESVVRRIVYTSSASVYGNPRYLPINEDDFPNLLSPYAVSKFAGEGYCRAFYETFDAPTSVVRYSNVYGYGQSPSNPYCGVIGKFFQLAREGKALTVHGDGLQTRDFTFVEDVVEATLLVLLSPRAAGEVFNIGTGTETNIVTLAETIASTVGNNVMLEFIDRRDIDNIRRRVLNIEKIRRALHWVPRFTLKQGLERTCNGLAS